MYSNKLFTVEELRKTAREWKEAEEKVYKNIRVYVNEETFAKAKEQLELLPITVELNNYLAADTAIMVDMHKLNEEYHKKLMNPRRWGIE